MLPKCIPQNKKNYKETVVLVNLSQIMFLILSGIITTLQLYLLYSAVNSLCLSIRLKELMNE